MGGINRTSETRKGGNKGIQRTNKTVLAELRSKHRSGGLSPGEASSIILFGNHEHMDEVKLFGRGPRDRHEAIMDGMADGMVWACSDSRVGAIGTNDEMIILEQRSAGNSFAFPDTRSHRIQMAVIGRVRRGGLLAIAGHVSCGAVQAKADLDAQGPDAKTGNAELDAQLREVVGDSEEKNVLSQTCRLREANSTMGKLVVGVMLDWASEGVAYSVLDGGRGMPGPSLQQPFVGASELHAIHAQSENYLERMKGQSPHTIIVAPATIPYSVHTIVQSEPGEVFVVTGTSPYKATQSQREDNDLSLDYPALGSLYYPIEHLGTRNVIFLDDDANPELLKSKFAAWEKGLRALKHKGEEFVARLIDEGKLQLTKMVYELDSGKIREFP